MRMPRTFRIISLMSKVVALLLNNEKLFLKGSLAKLDQLGGVYIKFLQIVVLNMNSHEQEDFKDMLNVYENSKPDKVNLRNHLLGQGYRHLDAFAEIEPAPFATGSFGQVYHAKLTTGENVIIKILRPSVMRYLKYDLRLLNFMSWAYSLVDRQKMINFRSIYKELRKTSINETSYLREAEMADRYYQTYKDHSQLVIPKTYLELSTDTMIVQDFVDGLSVAKLLEMQSGGVNAVEYVRTELNGDLFSMLHVVGFELLSKAVLGDLLQADPHPGNIILLRDNKVAMIDFGMVAALSENRVAFYEMLLQYRDYYSNNLAIDSFTLAALKYLIPELYAAIEAADQIPGLSGGNGFKQTSLKERFRQATASIAEEVYGAPGTQNLLENKMIMKVLFFAINRGNRFGLTFDLKSIMLLKASQTYLSLVAQFDPKAHYVIGQVIDDVIQFTQANMDKLMTEEPIRLEPAVALEILSTWFDKMSRNDPWLMQQLIGGYIK